MGINLGNNRVMNWIKKYKYAVLIMLLGVVFMCFPTVTKDEQQNIETVPVRQQVALEERLEEILSNVKGAGKVKVMLTISEGERTIYQYDEDNDYSGTTNSERKDTVIVKDNDRNEQAVITQILPPVYRGAVVLCQGADQPAVKLAVVEAVSKLTGLGADKISVLKMK